MSAPLHEPTRYVAANRIGNFEQRLPDVLLPVSQIFRHLRLTFPECFSVVQSLCSMPLAHRVAAWRGPGPDDDISGAVVFATCGGSGLGSIGQRLCSNRPMPAENLGTERVVFIFTNPPPRRSIRIALMPRSHPAFKRARLFPLASDALRLPKIESTSSYKSLGCESAYNPIFSGAALPRLELTRGDWYPNPLNSRHPFFVIVDPPEMVASTFKSSDSESLFGHPSESAVIAGFTVDIYR